MGSNIGSGGDAPKSRKRSTSVQGVGLARLPEHGKQAEGFPTMKTQERKKYPSVDEKAKNHAAHVPKSTGGKPFAQGGENENFAAGRARTNKGKNKNANSQAMRG